MSDQMPLHAKCFVPGTPAAKGSFKAFMPKGGRHPILTNDCKRTKPWEQRIALAIHAAWPHGLMRGGVSLSLYFTFARPQSHYGTGRNAGTLKPAAPHEMLKTPDVDKLERAVLDALKGVLYVDDKQVFRVRKLKLYGETPGVRIHIVARPEPITHADLKQWGATQEDDDA